MVISNTQTCFVQLWLRLERTRRLLQSQHKRFCILNVTKSWLGIRASDDMVWEVCNMCEQEGWNQLPPPVSAPRPNREFLRALVAVRLGISYWKVNLRALDRAYSVAFPGSTPINVNKKTPSEGPPPNLPLNGEEGDPTEGPPPAPP